MVKTPGSSALMRRDALEGLDPVAPALLHARRQRQHERVEDEVRRLEPVALHGDVVDGPGGAQLPLGRAGLAFGVDAGAHHGGAVLPGQGEEPVEPGAGIVALLEVDRVEDGPAADPLRAASTTGASVESTMSGTLAWVAKRLATSVMSATPSAPV